MNKDYKKKFSKSYSPNNFDRFGKSSRGFSSSRENMDSKEGIAGLVDGDYFRGLVKILRRTQPGPIIFVISDGYMMIEAVTKESQFQVGAIVELAGQVSARAGKLQIEIDSVKQSNENFDIKIQENSVPVDKPFSIKSERLDKLRPYFLKIAKRIRKAVLENKSILIRHHADADGITSGMAMEHSIKQFMEKIGVTPEYNLYRSPSKAPFYEISDVFRDVVLTKRIIEGHGQEKPLIIVLDNGSTPEDVLGIRTLNSLGFEVIVVDHHNPVIIENKKTAVCPYVSFHLNPYIEGLDGKTSAGMLSYELGRLISEDYDEPLLPAVAGIADHCDIQETEDYIKNTGRTREELTRIGFCVDFIAYNLKYDAGKGLFEELFTKPDFVNIIGDEVKKGVETQLQSTLPYLRTQDLDGVIFSTIDLEKYTVRFKYPAPGKVLSLIHDSVEKGNVNMPSITAGHLSDMVIIRASAPILPVQKIIKKLKKDLPHANVDGGGHECAGAIKFVSAHLTDVLENIKQQIKDLHYLDNLKEE